MSKGNYSKVLLIDDDENIHKLVNKYMNIFGDTLDMKIYHALNLSDGKNLIEDYNIDYIVTDFLISEYTILDLIEWLDKTHKLIPVDCLTSIQDTDLITRLSNLGVKNIMYKPISIYNFLQIVYQNTKKIQLKYKEGVTDEIEKKQR